MASSPPSSRRKSRLSFGSLKSHKSSGSVPQVDLHETSKEKSARRIKGKADPSLAISEAQPAARQLEENTIEPLRAMQHRDMNGNVITDPDRSNPTRPRMERPLDTIRAFEAAIDGGYNRRFSRVEPDASQFQSRRSSAFFSGNNNDLIHQQRYPRDAGGGNYYATSRPQSYVDPSSSFNGQYNHSQGRKFSQRVNSDPALYGHNGHGVYPVNGFQQSYDTVTSSGTGSHGTDQWGNSTDPSSENSSIDKIQQGAKQDLGEQYGFNGFGGAPAFQGPILEEHGQGAPEYGRPGYGGRSVMASGPGIPYQGNNLPPPPPPPAHAKPREPVSRGPIKLGNSTSHTSNENQQDYSTPSVNGEKRKSWLKRRFSKNY